MSKVYSFEFIKDFIESKEYNLLSNKEEYKDGSSELRLSDSEGYLYNKCFNGFKETTRRGKLLVFSKYNKYQINNIQLWLDKNEINWNAISESEERPDCMILFHCNVCHNDFYIRLFSVMNIGCKCPYCQKKRVSDINSIAYNLKTLIPYFDIEKNFPENPNTVSIGSSKKIWWKCPDCHCSWCLSSCEMKSREQVGFCTSCSGQSVSDKNRMIVLYPKTAEEWDYRKNSNIDISDITYSSNKKVWWVCSLCGNNYKRSVSQKIKEVTGCPKCNRYSLTNKNRFSVLFPEIATEWDYDKNKNDPSEYSFGSRVKMWWICPICNSSYDCSISNRVHDRGCPVCNLSGKVQRIYKYLKSKNINFKYEYWFDDLRSDLGRVLKYDFGILDENKDIKLLLEYDDAQHDRYIESWHKTIENFEYRKELDKRKDEYAKNHNIPLLRINYKDKEIENILDNFLFINL